MLFRRSLAVAALTVATASFLHAADVLNPGDYIYAPAPEPIALPTILTSSIVDFSTGAISGKLGVYVLEDFAANPFHGLTFVYELKNVGSGPSDGFTSLELGGWLGLNIAVTQRDTLYFAPSSSPVLPLDFGRSSGLGDTIKIGFPPDINAPPIFSGESSFGLVIFTDATAWKTTTATVTAANFDTTDETHTTIQTIGAASAPDAGSSALLLILAVTVLGVTSRRTRQTR